VDSVHKYTLTSALCANPVFSQIMLGSEPHWLVNLVNLSGQTATVLFNYEDLTGVVTKQASMEGVAMFGLRVKFMYVGPKGLVQQCECCWQMGHIANSPHYCVPISEIHCSHCNSPHAPADHDYYCPANTHKTPGKCDCVLLCLLCKKMGHYVRYHKCPNRGDFNALPIARVFPKDGPVVLLPPRPVQKPSGGCKSQLPLPGPTPTLTTSPATKATPVPHPASTGGG
jgi:hypothetical protein